MVNLKQVEGASTLLATGIPPEQCSSTSHFSPWNQYVQKFLAGG